MKDSYHFVIFASLFQSLSFTFEWYRVQNCYPICPLVQFIFPIYIYVNITNITTKQFLWSYVCYSSYTYPINWETINISETDWYILVMFPRCKYWNLYDILFVESKVLQMIKKPIRDNNSLLQFNLHVIKCKPKPQTPLQHFHRRDYDTCYP
jgi:hypothetical protein